MAVRRRVIVMGVCVTVMLAVLSGVGVHLWLQHRDKPTAPPGDVALSMAGGAITLYIVEGATKAYLVVTALPAEGRYKELGSQVGVGAEGLARPCPGFEPNPSGLNAICVVWDDGSEFHVTLKDLSSLDPPVKLDCVTVSWNVTHRKTEESSSSETPTDCYDATHASWYGAFEDFYQHWPLNNKTQMNMSAYVTGEPFNRIEYGEVIEPLFISSLGLGIHVDEKAPLFVAIGGNTPSICLQGRIGPDSPYSIQHRTKPTPSPWLRYDICRATDIASLWKGMSRVYLPRPELAPSEDVVRRPIWSTWARYKAAINQTATLEFARQILENNLTASQMEIDDDWTPHYGDMTFTPDKFTDAAAMVNELERLGMKTTVWAHPFINTDADSYEVASKAGYFVMEAGADGKGTKPAGIDWWRGNGSGLIDFTNPDAVSWYLDNLRNLQSKYNVSSFKFDAGEVTFLPHKPYRLHKELDSPNDFTTYYVEAATHSDMDERRQEVRVGFRSQKYHTLVRQLDRASNWTHSRGLLTLIPAALTFGIAGYPFVLPDMIGGNAYNATNIDQTVLPDRELFVRWLQATLFMPTLQFSVAPWDYDDGGHVTRITQEMMSLREGYLDDIVSLMEHARTTGEPIVRPLWWIDPTSTDALACETEYLMGDDLLVAPVLEDKARSRDIYLPRGTWRDELRGVTFEGGKWLNDYKADLSELPHFTRLKSNIVG